MWREEWEKSRLVPQASGSSPGFGKNRPGSGPHAATIYCYWVCGGKLGRLGGNLLDRLQRKTNGRPFRDLFSAWQLWQMFPCYPGTMLAGRPTHALATNSPSCSRSRACPDPLVPSSPAPRRELPQPLLSRNVAGRSPANNARSKQTANPPSSFRNLRPRRACLPIGVPGGFFHTLRLVPPATFSVPPAWFGQNSGNWGRDSRQNPRPCLRRICGRGCRPCRGRRSSWELRPFPRPPDFGGLLPSSGVFSHFDKTASHRPRTTPQSVRVAEIHASNSRQVIRTSRRQTALSPNSKPFSVVGQLLLILWMMNFRTSGVFLHGDLCESCFSSAPSRRMT